MSTTNALGKTKQRKKSKMCEMSADKVLQAIEDAKTGPDAFECVRHYARVKQHYDHAREKHSYFCDIITCLSDVGSDTHLDIYRATLRAESENEAVEAGTLLGCEFYEAIQAYTHGDTSHAVEECYDAIAVLLRTIDVLEGRQRLGKPEEKGDAK